MPNYFKPSLKLPKASTLPSPPNQHRTATDTSPNLFLLFKSLSHEIKHRIVSPLRYKLQLFLTCLTLRANLQVEWCTKFLFLLDLKTLSPKPSLSFVSWKPFFHSRMQLQVNWWWLKRKKFSLSSFSHKIKSFSRWNRSYILHFESLFL